jgi:hypothetical protein
LTGAVACKKATQVNKGLFKILTRKLSLTVRITIQAGVYFYNKFLKQAFLQDLFLMLLLKISQVVMTYITLL